MDILKYMGINYYSKANIVKITILFVWCLLFILLLKRDVFLETVDLREIATIELAEAEEYQSVYFKREKIGHVMQRYSKQPDDTIELVQKAQLNLNVAGSIQGLQLNLLATLTEKTQLKSFNFSFNSPFYKMNATGTVEGNSISYTIHTGNNTISDSVTLPQPPILTTARRPYLLKENIQPGDKVKIPWFDPFSLTGKESVIEYKGKEAIQIRGRIQNLHHFIESFSGSRINLWLNDSGRVVKQESPAGFIFIKEPKFKALQQSSTSDDILNAVAVQRIGPLTLRDDTMQYRLSFPEDAILDLSGGRQQFQDGILTVTSELHNKENHPSCTPSPEDYQATPYVQVNHQEIMSLSSSLTAETNNTYQKVEVLADWVHNNIEKRPVLGLPDALTTLKNLRGDCNEHAALFAALARASGLPTRIVAGVTSHKEGFYYHAWNEVCLDNSWMSIDTTTNQKPADLSHIRLVIGEMQEQVRIGALLGKLVIEPLAEDSP
ncbi:transglutaminase-like domain-containing protein [Desulforhopalus sp. 52FAK]